MADAIFTRAQFLLRLGAAVSPTAESVARSRWKLAGRLSSSSTVSSSPGVEGEDPSPSLSSVVEEARLSSELASLADLRRMSLIRASDGKAVPLHDLARKFCADVTGCPVEDLSAGLSARALRAEYRAIGIDAAVTLLNSTALPSRASLWLLQSLSIAFQSTGYHPLHRLSGAPVGLLSRLSRSFSSLLSSFGRLLSAQLAEEQAAAQMDVLARAGNNPEVGADGNAGEFKLPVMPKLSRFESTVSASDVASLPGGLPLRRESSSRSSISRPSAVNAWLPLFAPDALARLGWTRILYSDFPSGCSPFAFTSDELSTLWGVYAPNGGRADMQPSHVVACVDHLRQAFEACFPAIVAGIELRNPGDTSRDLTVDQVTSLLADTDTIGSLLANALDTDSDGCVSRVEFITSLGEALLSVLAEVKVSAVADGDEEDEVEGSVTGGSLLGNQLFGDDSDTSSEGTITLTQRRTRRARRSPRAARGRARASSIPRGGPTSDTTTTVSRPGAGDRLSVAYTTTWISRGSRGGKSRKSVAEGAVIERIQVDEKLTPEQDRRELVLALLRACQLHYRPADHTALWESGIVTSLGDILLNRHVEAMLSQVSSQLDGVGVTGDAAGVVLKLARERAMFDKTSISYYAHDRAMSLLRVIVVTCLGLPDDAVADSPLLGPVAEQLVAVISRVLQRTGVTPSSEDIVKETPAVQEPIIEVPGEATADDTADEPADVKEVSLLSSSTFLPLSVSGSDGLISANTISGYTAPNVNLSKSGFSVGWRMYWPREDQQSSLASGSVVEGNAETGPTLTESGVIFTKGWQVSLLYICGLHGLD